MSNCLKFRLGVIPDGFEQPLLAANDRRIRAVAQGADGAVYVLTDSEDNSQTNRHLPGQVLKLTPLP